MAASQTSSHRSSNHRLAPPDPDFEPAKVNVYETMRRANAALTPFFPMVHPGAMLPAGAVMRGGLEYGRFFHRNSEEEVLLSMGGVRNSLKAGMMVITGKMHEVSTSISLEEPSDPEGSGILVITQRQPDDGDQHETLLFRCDNCNEKLFEFSFDSSQGTGHSAEAYGGRDDDPYPMFPTMWGSAEAAEQLNKSEESRTCNACGHVNPQFPTDRWGWPEWVAQHRVVNAAHHSLETAMENRGIPKGAA